MRTIRLRMNLNCRACQVSNPLNTIADEVTCYHCGEKNALDTKFWTWFVHPEIFDRASKLPAGEEGKSGRVMPVCTVHYARSAPHCAACKTELPVASLGEQVAAGRCFCPGCGATVALRAADELCKALHRGATFVVGESAGMAAVQAATSPVVFGCMSCGGGLEVDGTARMVTCSYCNASNYLPDGLWRQLHPVPKPHDFYLVYR